MEYSPFYYFIFAILYFISIKCLQSENTIIVGLGFLFAVNLIFTIYFVVTQIPIFKLSDDILINLGRSAIAFNSIFLMMSLICAIIMIVNINEEWKKKKGTSLELPPFYKKNMDMFKDSIIDNIYYEAIIILFVVIFKTKFNNINQFDTSAYDGVYGYLKKLVMYVYAGLVSVFYFNVYLKARANHIWLQKWFPTSYESFQDVDVITFMWKGFLYCMYYLLWLPLLILLCLIAFIMTIFTKIVPEVYRRGFRYIYVTAVPILSLVIIGSSIYQLYLAGSFTKLKRQQLIT